MIRFAGAAPTRQAVLTGRVFERLSERDVTGLTARLLLVASGGARRPLPARFVLRPGGWFAFFLDPGRDLATFQDADAAALRVEFAAPGRPDQAQEVPVVAADLRPVAATVTIGGQPVPIRRLAARAPTLSAPFDPAAVALEGVILREGDPEDPASGAQAAIGALSAVADAAGRFRLAPLPLSAEVALTVTDGAQVSQHRHRIDWESPVNRIVLSLPAPGN